MEFNCHIEMDNAAFEDAPATELARILRKLAGQIEEGMLPDGDRGRCLDVNGNYVGNWNID